MKSPLPDVENVRLLFKKQLLRELVDTLLEAATHFSFSTHSLKHSNAFEALNSFKFSVGSSFKFSI